MAWTSPTTINATQGLDSFLPYLSEVTNFWFGRMLMIAVFIIFLFGYLRAKNNDFYWRICCFNLCNFCNWIIIWVIGLVSGLDFAIIISATAIASVLLLTQKKDY